MLGRASTTVLVALLAGGAPAQAATTHYTSALFFGDSLTDDGNLFAATLAQLGQGTPGAPYVDGRFSNGPVWADGIAGDFAAKGLHTENYAYGSAQAVTNGDQIPDLPAQVEAFERSGTAALLGERPVATLWFGANDLFSAIKGDFTTVPAVAMAAAGAVAGGIESLAESGIRDFLVFNMVPLEKTPQFALGPPEGAALAKVGVDVFNETLERMLTGFGGDTKVTKLDIHAAMDVLIANPGDFGVSDATFPCFVPPAGPLCSAEEAAQKVFWDPVHPTTQIHGAIADLVRAEVAPVPLPAPLLMLLAGMAALAAVGARRRA